MNRRSFFRSTLAAGAATAAVETPARAAGIPKMKVTRVREQMRVLEAKVNADEKLPTEDIVDLEARVTAVYEALDALIALVAR